MNPANLIFNLVCWGGFLGMLITYSHISVRRGSVHPGLWLTVATFSIFWMESPFDWSMYAQFHPDLAKFPAWGVIGMTWGGLPLIAMPGYVMYFGIPSVIAVKLARRSQWKSLPIRLLTYGLVVGFLWDMTFEIIGTQLGLWRFARTAPGLVLWPETKFQVPIYCFLAMGLPIMVATYLTGRANDRGENLFESWSRRMGHAGWKPHLVSLIGFVAAIHLVYGISMAPHAFTKIYGLQTTISPEELFAGFPNQPR